MSAILPVSNKSNTSGEVTCSYAATAPTSLRCAKCARPLLVKDAQRVFNGYTCAGFIKARQNIFYNASFGHYVIIVILGALAGALIGAGLYVLASSLLFYGFFLMTAIGPAVGGAAVEVIRRAIGKARGRNFWLAAAIATGTGAGLVLLIATIVTWVLGDANLVALLSAGYGLALVLGMIATRLRM